MDKSKHNTRSVNIKLLESTWEGVDKAALAVGCLATKGRTKGQPSPNNLLKCIGEGSVMVVKVPSPRMEDKL